MSDETIKQRQRRTRDLAKKWLIMQHYNILPISRYIFHLEARKGPLTLWIHVTPTAPTPEIYNAIKKEKTPDGIKKEIWIRDYSKKAGFQIINV